MLEDVFHDDLVGLLRTYKSFAVTLMAGPVHEIGDALEAIGNAGYWLSPSAARRMRENDVATAQGDGNPRLTPSEQLTTSEQRILELILRGMSNGEIADQLVIGVATVKTHTRGILRKTGHPNRQRLIASRLET